MSIESVMYGRLVSRSIEPVSRDAKVISAGEDGFVRAASASVMAVRRVPRPESLRLVTLNGLGLGCPGREQRERQRSATDDADALAKPSLLQLPPLLTLAHAINPRP
jgi:hypothetical protein